jgi:hypothetical protein
MARDKRLPHITTIKSGHDEFARMVQASDVLLSALELCHKSAWIFSGVKNWTTPPLAVQCKLRKFG